jgi:hypothetical protein
MLYLSVAHVSIFVGRASLPWFSPLVPLGMYVTVRATKGQKV